MHVQDVAADLVAEQQDLDDVVSILDGDGWTTATPSPRWTVADQVAHLTYFDEAAATAITDPDAFSASIEGLMAVARNGDGAVDDLTRGAYLSLGPEGLLDAWRAGRARLAEAAATLADDDRVAWYGPSMGARSGALPV